MKKRYILFKCFAMLYCSSYADDLITKYSVESAATVDANSANSCSNNESATPCEQKKPYHSNYINVNNYIMNPYNNMPSAGGMHLVNESDVINQDIWDQFLHNGTYNAVGLASWANLMGSNNYGYGTNIFAQSGHVYGFAVGGMLEVINPFLQPGERYLDGDISYSSLPNTQVVSPSELYVEYQLPGILQVDAGRIFLDIPWLNSYDDAFLTSGDFDGILANYQLSNNWRLTAVATDGYQEFGSYSFSRLTVYNKQYNGNGFQLGNNVVETNSYAMGAVYKPSSDYELNLWGYNLGNYTNMLYADSDYMLHLNQENKLDFGVQTGNQNTLGMGSNVNQSAGYGSPNSYLIGAKLGYDYSYWLETEASFDGMYGPQNAFYQGGFVSPYTYSIVNDPLYTSGLAGGLIEQGAGSSWRIATTFKPLYDDLKIELAYEEFITASPMDSYDLDIKYKPFDNEFKGLVLHLWVNYTMGPATNMVNPGDFLFVQTMASYNF